MKNLYHKVAVASVCTALSFALGVNEEAKAATITSLPTTTFGVLDVNDGANSFDGVGDELLPAGFPVVLKGTEGEAAQFAEFNIGSFSQIPNIISAIFRAEISSFQVSGLGVNQPTNPGSVGLFGYVGNGTAETSDFEAGVLLTSLDVSGLSPGALLNFDVTQFVKQGVSNNNPFAGFGIRALNLGGLSLKGGDLPGSQPKLIVETAEVAEPVPEPTTIFGSAIGLCVGGWLKRKKSTPQNKTTSQG